MVEPTGDCGLWQVTDGDVTLQLPGGYVGFDVQTGTSLELLGPLIMTGNSQGGVGVAGFLNATEVTFTSFSGSPVSLMAGAAYIDSCIFTTNTAPGIIVQSGSE